MHNPFSDKNADDSSSSETFWDKDPDFATNSMAVQTLNSSLQELGESPIDKRKIKSRHYASSKVKKISSSMKQKFFVAAENSSSENDNQIDESILQNLKSSFLDSTCRTKKLMLLTC
ncbi:hypothetical protein AVEN_213722-1 [Araneus ventricosus]|uniref:Uncharacterized protein n=1 Tax=Araneus ventricosus TaxID=182803 RepID=A0A4Y2GQ45_ARAVE|nr:hypothetical protein AVEN_213722-1 [Araneus ventricosus]